MKSLLFGFLSLVISSLAFSQEYKFSPIYDIEATEVKSQDITGTCWSYSTSSFLESEIMRLTGKKIDVSEMYTVRNTYSKKAWNYLMRQGKAQFSQGGLAHDVMNSIRVNGLVPEYAYTGLDTGKTKHNHTEMVEVIKGMLNVYIDNPARTLSPKWKTAVESVLDVYLGEKPASFNYEGVQYTPESFLEMTKINPDDYVTITSFTHQPYNTSFILSIPDNFSNGSFYNVPLDQMMDVIDHALKNGFTVELDCDVSEKTFSSKTGVAVVPEDSADNKKAAKEIVAEKTIDAKYRQQEFENFHTTDDHLMHITGLLKDQNGTKYYKVKNSWGTKRHGNNGYMNMSESFMRLKTISVMVHKDALPKALKKQLNL